MSWFVNFFEFPPSQEPYLDVYCLRIAPFLLAFIFFLLQMQIMLNKNRPLVTLLVMMCLLGWPALTFGQAITPNTRYFSVEEYYVPSPEGTYSSYSARGFFEPGVDGGNARLYLLPTIQFGPGCVKYFDANGVSFTPRDFPTRTVKSVKIALRYSDALPNAYQKLGIASVLGSESKSTYFPAPAIGSDGRPILYPPAQMSPDIVTKIIQTNAAIATKLEEQKRLSDKWDQYSAESISVDELSISVRAEGQEMASMHVEGTITSLPSISFQNPTVAQINMLESGDAEVLVSFGFTDSKISSIEATFNAEAIMSNFLDESQKAVTDNKTTGFAIFGLGYRRSKITQSFSHTVDSKTSSLNQSKTRIVMNDASDDMVKQFEAAFFPVLEEKKTIQNHLDAAEKAFASGDINLQKVHLDYAKALQDKDALKEVDAVAAAAALASQNWAMFIAQGVRAQISRDNNSYEFRQVLKDSVDIRKKTEWTQTRRVSVQRQITIPVAYSKPVERLAFWGIQDIVPYTFSYQTGFWINSPFGPQLEIKQMTGIMVLAIAATGPAAQAGILPGMVINGIDGAIIKTIQDFQRAHNSARVGDESNFRFFDFTTPRPATSYKNILLKNVPGPLKRVLED